jgi:hypothetical protein
VVCETLAVGELTKPGKRRGYHCEHLRGGLSSPSTGDRSFLQDVTDSCDRIPIAHDGGDAKTFSGDGVGVEDAVGVAAPAMADTWYYHVSLILRTVGWAIQQGGDCAGGGGPLVA